MLGTCPRTREYSGTMASTIGPRPWSRTDSTGHSTRVVDREGAARWHEGWSRVRGRSDSDVRELETSPSAAEAANSRLYLPVEYDRVQGLSYRSNNPIPRTEKKSMALTKEFQLLNLTPLRLISLPDAETLIFSPIL